MENQQRQSKLLFDCLLVGLPLHNLCNSVAGDEQTTSETQISLEGPNCVEILG